MTFPLVNIIAKKWAVDELRNCLLITTADSNSNKLYKNSSFTENRYKD
ncbi:hypothetical protein ACQY1Q_09315 [Tenacibaculum sp. TC6]